jgi:hypothetical protein
METILATEELFAVGPSQDVITKTRLEVSSVGRELSFT